MSFEHDIHLEAWVIDLEGVLPTETFPTTISNGILLSVDTFTNMSKNQIFSSIHNIWH